MSDDKRLIIVISNREEGGKSIDWGIIHEGCPDNNQQCTEPCLYYNHISKVIRHSRKDFEYSFSFIKQENYNIETLTNIINENKAKQIAIAVHSTKYFDIRNNITKIQNEIEIKSFSHETNAPDQIWKNLKPLLECIRDRGSNYELLYDNLWRCLAPTIAQHTYKVLSAFFPLDLELQLENNDEECEKVVGKIIGLKSDTKERMEKIKELIKKHNNKLPNNIGSIFELAEGNLKCLLEIARKVRESGQGSIFEEFHQKYEELRNNLLDIVYAFREIGSS